VEGEALSSEANKDARGSGERALRADMLAGLDGGVEGFDRWELV